VAARRHRTTRYVRASLEPAADMAVVADVPDARGAVDQVLAFYPDVLLVEVVDDAVDALELTRLVAASSHPSPPAVLLMADEVEDSLVRGLWRGARGLLPRQADPDLLVHAVRLVAAGYLVVPPPMRDCALRNWAPGCLQGGPAHAVLDRLTPRELDVLGLVACGHSNAEISSRLRLSESTVKSYLQRILDKLDLRNRVGIVILAHETGLK
jgi:DNA-binding NarL/FixJ family response regulator